MIVIKTHVDQGIDIPTVACLCTIDFIALVNCSVWMSVSLLVFKLLINTIFTEYTNSSCVLQHRV